MRYRLLEVWKLAEQGDHGTEFFRRAGFTLVLKEALRLRLWKDQGNYSMKLDKCEQTMESRDIQFLMY